MWGLSGRKSKWGDEECLSSFEVVAEPVAIAVEAVGVDDGEVKFFGD